jgi:hypothetical protein
MIYGFKKRKSFSEDARRSQSILNGTVDLHVQTADHHRNIAGIGIQHPLMSPESGDGIRPSGQTGRLWPERPAGQIRPLSPESGYPIFRRNCLDSGLYLEF